MTLADLKIGQDAVLRTIGGQGELRHHLLDMGLTPGTEVTLRKVAPMGDPIEVELRGYELTLRLDDAAKIEVENVHETDRAARSEERHTAVPHPGVGELRKAPSYHDRKSGAEIPKGQPLRFALAGNQNCGKTTLFNQLTGSNQHVGNFPGVTVDRKDGVIRGHAEATVTDLPGIYSLSPYSSEEIVTRDFLLNTHPDGIINIVDASNIERNLYLTMQLMELNIPLVLALNMMDEVRANGGTIMVNELEELLGVPVVPISAAKNEGIDELVEHALHVARHRETPGRIDFCDAGDGAGGAVHRCVHAVSHLIEDHAARTGLPLRFSATKLVEGDTLIESALDLDANETELLGHTIAELESETGLDREAALADMRFNFIERLCDKTVVRPGESREHKRSVAIDRILTGKYTALPCFIGIMALVFWLTFGVIGTWLVTRAAPGKVDRSNVIYGSEGAAFWGEGIYNGKQKLVYPLNDLYEAFIETLSEEEKDIYFPYGLQDTLAIEWKQHFDALNGLRQVEVDAMTGYKAMGVPMAIYESATLGEPVLMKDVMDLKIEAYQGPLNRLAGI